MTEPFGGWALWEGMDTLSVFLGRGCCACAQVFYAATQALLYVLCYRLPHLMELGAAPPAPQGNGHGEPASAPSRASQGAGSGTGPGQAADAAAARALRQLLRSIVPELLGHRCAARRRPALCGLSWNA